MTLLLFPWAGRVAYYICWVHFIFVVQNWWTLLLRNAQMYAVFINTSIGISPKGWVRLTGGGGGCFFAQHNASPKVLSQHSTVSSRIPQRAEGWLTLGGKPKKPLLFPLLQHLTRDGILYITLRAPGSSCGQSEPWPSANIIVLPTRSQTACPGCPLPLLLVEDLGHTTQYSCVCAAIFFL